MSMLHDFAKLCKLKLIWYTEMHNQERDQILEYNNIVMSHGIAINE